VERNALELKGTHIGWTCPQVKEMVQAALGGCLFLDEGAMRAHTHSLMATHDCVCGVGVGSAVGCMLAPSHARMALTPAGSLRGCAAYALSGGGKDGDRGDSFSDEALRTLLTETENHRTSLCVVLAGYAISRMEPHACDPSWPRGSAPGPGPHT